MKFLFVQVGAAVVRG